MFEEGVQELQEFRSCRRKKHDDTCEVAKRKAGPIPHSATPELL
jgi:hypothetical protein